MAQESRVKTTVRGFKKVANGESSMRARKKRSTTHKSLGLDDDLCDRLDESRACRTCRTYGKSTVTHHSHVPVAKLDLTAVCIWL